LLSADGLQADESLLTGEAVPVGKRVATPPERAAVDAPGGRPHVAPGGDEQPTVYAGALIVQGHALAQVLATGERSETCRCWTSCGVPC
jgi:Ca2+-transporting ATPase